MADPQVVAISQWVWTKVATNITTGTVHRLNTLVDYYQTYRDTGGSAPSAPTVGTVPTEAVKMFNSKAFEDTEYTTGIDVYIMGGSRSQSSNIGSVRVDL